MVDLSTCVCECTMMYMSFMTTIFNVLPCATVTLGTPGWLGSSLVVAMEHLQGLWKDAPAISRSFTVIPLGFHCASWRVSALNVLKLSLYSFRSDDHRRSRVGFSCWAAVVQWSQWYCYSTFFMLDGKGMSLWLQNLQVCKDQLLISPANWCNIWHQQQVQHLEYPKALVFLLKSSNTTNNIYNYIHIYNTLYIYIWA